MQEERKMGKELRKEAGGNREQAAFLEGMPQRVRSPLLLTSVAKT